MYLIPLSLNKIMENENLGIGSYKKEDKKSLAEVIISHIDFCRKELSKQLRPGFKQQTVMEGHVITIEVPDQRQVNKQCVKTLSDLLEFYFDEKFIKQMGKIQKNFDDSGEKFMKIYLSKEQNEHLKSKVEKQKALPGTSLGDNVRQQWINYLDELYRIMFKELILLFKRKNELSGKRSLGYK